MDMGIYVITALIVVIPLTSGVLPVFVQQPSFKGDRPLPISMSRLHIAEVLSSKLLIQKVEPDYPDDAKAAGVEGDVVFRIIIGTDGRVKEIHLRHGKPLLIEVAAKAVSKWQYRPYIFNGHAVEVETFATVRFQLPSKHE